MNKASSPLSHKEHPSGDGPLSRRPVDIAVVTALPQEMPLFNDKEYREDDAAGQSGRIFYARLSCGDEDDSRGRTVAHTVTGAGKVAAATGLSTLLSEIDPRVLICGGIAGSLKDDLPPETVTVARSTWYWDRDATAVGFPLGTLTPGEPEEYLLPRGTDFATQLQIPTVRVASGDSVVTRSLLEEIPPHWRERVVDHSDLVDMESAVWAEVAGRWGCEPIIVRTVYDMVLAPPGTPRTSFAAACRAAAEAIMRVITLF